MLKENTVECICGTVATMAGAEYGHSARFLLHPLKCDLFGDFHAGLGWACTLPLSGKAGYFSC